MIAKIQFENFTAFKKLEIEFSPGINIFVGSNGTGKTHILKTVYASCDITKSKKNFAEKILRVFMPSSGQLGRLVKRQKVSIRGSIEIFRSGPGLLSTGKLLMKRDEKPFLYVVLLGLDAFTKESALLVGFKDRLLKRIRQEAASPWVRSYVRDCIVVTLNTWGTNFPEYTVSRVVS